MKKRPVRNSVACFDHRREPDSKRSRRGDCRQTIKSNESVQLKPTASGAQRNLRTQNFVRNRTAVAIIAEGVNGPLSRRREVELVVCRLTFYRDESLEAGVLPELFSEARQS